jgi:hypothetical protein
MPVLAVNRSPARFVTLCVHGCQVLELMAGFGLGFRSIELSQLYENVACGASCFDLDACYFTGMEYSCVTVSCLQACVETWEGHLHMATGR